MTNTPHSARRREFLGAAQEIVHLLATGRIADTPQESTLMRRLDELSTIFHAQHGPNATDQPADEAWHAAIADTLARIEKAKRYFDSKEFGQLRARLDQVLARSKAP